MTNARGEFGVKMVPLESHNVAIGRMAGEKQFKGDLDATSKVEMLAFMTPVKGSAGYVAIELVAGALHGRKGTFVLQHSSTMAAGAQHQSVTVIPDSGTDELQGLSGSMTIIVADGGHSYDFNYEIASL